MTHDDAFMRAAAPCFVAVCPQQGNNRATLSAHVKMLRAGHPGRHHVNGNRGLWIFKWPRPQGLELSGSVTVLRWKHIGELGFIFVYLQLGSGNNVDSLINFLNKIKMFDQLWSQSSIPWWILRSRSNAPCLQGSSFYLLIAFSFIMNHSSHYVNFFQIS